MAKRRSALSSNSKSMLNANIGIALSSMERMSRSVSNLKAVKNVRQHSKYRGRQAKTNARKTVEYDGFRYRESGFKEFDNAIRMIVEDISATLRDKGRTWAIETMHMMKGLAPMRTENLMESIKILSADKAGDATINNKLEIIDKRGVIMYQVGIDEEAILPPPYRKKSKHGRTAGTMVTMADYNYAEAANKAILAKKSNGYQGYDFLRRWQQAAKENMERIFK